MSTIKSATTVTTAAGDVPVLDSTMHYREAVPAGAERGPAVLFLHGNPTSSFLWRNVIGPVAEGSGRRCVALDLIGMGESGKPGIEYRLADHIRYVRAFLTGHLDSVVLAGHDWGAVIALHLAGELPEQVQGVAFTEGHIRPIESWADLDEGGRAMFGQLRAPGVGEQMVLAENFFVEQVLPAGMMRTITTAEHDAYRAPYPDPESRRPTLVWPREIPIGGEPADVVDVVLANQRVIADPRMPALLLHATPGAVIGAAEVAWCRENGQALTIAAVGSGTHFLPEDQPEQITRALVGWLGAGGPFEGSSPGGG